MEVAAVDPLGDILQDPAGELPLQEEQVDGKRAIWRIQARFWLGLELWHCHSLFCFVQEGFASSVCPLGPGRMSLSCPHRQNKGRREREMRQHCELPAQEAKHTGLHPEGVEAD